LGFAAFACLPAGKGIFVLLFGLCFCYNKENQSEEGSL